MSKLLSWNQLPIDLLFHLLSLNLECLKVEYLNLKCLSEIGDV